jgi:tripartite ATP-independent transporter DctM subunit
VTPTEAALIAVLYAMLLGFLVYRTLTIKSFAEVLYESLMLSSIVLFCVGCAAIYAWVLAFYKIPQYLVETMSAMTSNPTVMLFMIVLVFLVVGMFIDAVPAIIIFAPLLKPVAETVGIHPLHFAIVGCITLAYGLITPPYGLCLLIASQIGGVNVIQPLKEVSAFLAAMLLVLLLTVFFPAVSLGIPKLFMPNVF